MDEKATPEPVRGAPRHVFALRDETAQMGIAPVEQAGEIVSFYVQVMQAGKGESGAVALEINLTPQALWELSERFLAEAAFAKLSGG